MKTRFLILTDQVITLFLIVGVSLLLSFLSIKPAKAQVAPFLITPYYGQKSITSNFDHELPNYGVDDTLVGFNGVRRGPPASVSNCTNGINGSCYNGHDGYDFPLYHEPVLAAAGGTVTQAGWNVPGVRSGLPSLLGFYIEIDHGIGYRTRYGHLSAIAVTVGQVVLPGQIIGTSGSTGNSQAAHLHFSLINIASNGNPTPVDPFGWSGNWTDPNSIPSYCFWKDGEWANYCSGGVSRPILQPVDGQQTIQVSDSATNSNSFSKGDTQNPNGCNGDCAGWTRNTNNFWYYALTKTIANSWAKWQPQGIPDGGGIYEILVYVPTANNQAWQAKYTIYAANNDYLGSATIDQVGVDPAGTGKRWLSIGTYYLTQGAYLRVTDATGETASRQFAADDVMFVRRGTTYAPDVRSSGGWTSTVYLRNNGGTAKYLFKCLDAAGAPVGPSYVDTLAAHAVTTPVCLVSGYSSVVVDASQDVSVLVENRKAGEATNYSGIPAGTGATGWDGTGTTLYVPTLKRGMYGRSGKIYVLNGGSTDTKVRFDLYELDNGFHYPISGNCESPTLQPQARHILQASDCGAPAHNTAGLYGVKITSISTGSGDPVDPLAAVVVEKNDTGAELQASTNAFAFGNGTNYSPLVKNSYWGNQATMVVQNVGSAATNVNVTYYFTGTTSSDSFSNLPAGASHVFAPQNGGVPSSTLASVRTTSTGQPLVTALYENKTGASWRMQHSGFTAGSKVVILPRLVKNYNDGSLTWQSGYLVQNVGTADATVAVNYYNMDGTYAGYTLSFVVQPNRSVVINVQNSSSMNAPWQGSAVVVAD